MMQNVEVSVEGRKLTIVVDLESSARPSGRGNTIVATTDNWVRIPEAGEGYSMNMVLVKKGK